VCAGCHPATLTLCLWTSGRYSATQEDGINCIPPRCSRHAFRYWLDAAVDLATGINRTGQRVTKVAILFPFYRVRRLSTCFIHRRFVQEEQTNPAHGDQ
jgi:hypothetical protein